MQLARFSHIYKRLIEINITGILLRITETTQKNISFCVAEARNLQRMLLGKTWREFNKGLTSQRYPRSWSKFLFTIVKRE
jgi:hypothetical protein